MEAAIRIFLANFILAVLFVSVPAGLAGVPVERSFKKLDLGMMLEAFSKLYPARERTDLFLNLAPGERFLEVNDANLPKDVAALVAKFLNNRLYRISAEYTKEFAERTRWEDLLTETAKKHGEVAVQSSIQGEKIVEIARWDDGTTTLILQRTGKVRFESKNQKIKPTYTFSIVYMDDEIWKERLTMEQEMF
jgi:hypothetical protein